jgi:hypothetical protein
MIPASQIRGWLSWLFFLGSLVAALLSAAYIPRITKAFWLDYPRSLVSELPHYSIQFLGLIPSVPTAIYAGVGVAILVAGLIQRLGASTDSKAHGVSLVALLVYHLLLMLWIGFVVAFFWLPRAKAGI